MKAMALEKPRTLLVPAECPDPLLGAGEIRLRVEACAVCRTDLHVVDGERLGRRVGVPWLGHTCGACAYCRAGAENLCDRPLFTGYTRDGGFATHVVADAGFVFDLGDEG
jgi:propanol-preferring alcohol dehydrogenase